MKLFVSHCHHIDTKKPCIVNAKQIEMMLKKKKKKKDEDNIVLRCFLRLHRDFTLKTRFQVAFIVSDRHQSATSILEISANRAMFIQIIKVLDRLHLFT